ncbi:MAG: hypothetical protein J6Q47_05345 [Paludibacteraceae bacterium]|mgnify:FL=1|jgi:membrane-bound ClpP family serine protease|nr:hypothetical protein [Paludibacteraceae bacterium]
MDILTVVLLLVAGLGLILMELFLLPGISIAGVCGVAALVGADYLAYVNISSTAGHIVLFVSLGILALGVYLFIKARTLDKMALTTDIDSKVELITDKIQIGDKGKTTSRLAPMGKIFINNITVEAKSIVGFIEENVEVEVIEINGNIVAVK